MFLIVGSKIVKNFIEFWTQQSKQILIWNNLVNFDHLPEKIKKNYLLQHAIGGVLTVKEQNSRKLTSERGRKKNMAKRLLNLAGL